MVEGVLLFVKMVALVAVHYYTKKTDSKPTIYLSFHLVPP